MEAIERTTREGRATTGNDLRTAAQTEGLEELLSSFQRMRWRLSLGGKR